MTSARDRAGPGAPHKTRSPSKPQYLSSLWPVTAWSAGLGDEKQFAATSAVTGGASRYFLRLEVARD